jgi:hypothetical protein
MESDGTTSEGPDEPTTGPAPAAPTIEFAKMFGEWSECSVKCGGGTRVRNYTCIEFVGDESWREAGAPPRFEFESQNEFFHKRATLLRVILVARLCKL